MSGGGGREDGWLMDAYFPLEQPAYLTTKKKRRSLHGPVGKLALNGCFWGVSLQSGYMRVGISCAIKVSRLASIGFDVNRQAGSLADEVETGMDTLVKETQR